MTPQTLAGEVSTLFTLPDVVVRARAVMDAPMGSAQALVDVIETDAGLAAMILRLANSVLYGHLGRVDDLGHALAIIGPGGENVGCGSFLGTFRWIDGCNTSRHEESHHVPLWVDGPRGGPRVERCPRR